MVPAGNAYGAAMATIVIGNDTSVHETVAPQAVAGAGGGTLKVEPDGYVLASGDTLNAIAIQADTSVWSISILGQVSSYAGSGSIGVLLANTGKSVSKLAIGEGAGIFSTSTGIDSTAALAVTNAGFVESGDQALIARAAGTSLVNSGVILNSGLSHLIEVKGAGLNTIKNTGVLDAGQGGGLGSAIHSFDPLSNDTVSNTGTIHGAIMLGGGKNTLANAGSITGLISTGDGDDKITSSGAKGASVVIDGAIATGGGKDAVTNAGEVNGEIDLGEGDDTLINSGTITYDVMLGAGNNVLTNSGTIAASGGTGVSSGAGNDKVTNSGHIHFAVSLGDGANVVSNSGRIGGNLALGAHNDVVTNTGTIEGDIQLGEGTNRLTITKGTAGAILGGSGTDIVTIGGEVKGTVVLGDGDDTITFTGSGRAASVNLGEGKDTYIGSAESEIATDSNGSDTFRLGAGNDTYRAALGTSPGLDGLDTADGGTGLADLYDAGDGVSATTINLGTVDFKHAFNAFAPIAKSTAAGAEIGTDTIFNFEAARGGAGDDTIVGSSLANELSGGAGSDHLFGLAGNDRLEGGSGPGIDRLYGGLGADVLYGAEASAGADFAADVFVFESIADSTLAAKGRDTIMDFETGFDKVDLSAIDANTKNGTSANDAFTWLGLNARFTGNPGDLRYLNVGTKLTVVYGDTNGDKKADFAINFDGQLSLAGSDFIL